MARMMKQVDENGDGAITLEELKKRMGGGARPQGARPQISVKQVIERMDKNGDGKITQDDLPERAAAMFKKMDGDGNGELSNEEIEKMIKARMQGGRRPQGGRGGDQKKRSKRPDA